MQFLGEDLNYRRRIKTEETAKVVAAVWREEFIKFLAALAILPRTILKNRINSSFSFKSSWCNSSYNSNRPVQYGLNHSSTKTMPRPYTVYSICTVSPVQFVYDCLPKVKT